MKEYFNKFKEFRKDPKKKSISLIIIYGIFFVLVYFYLKANPSSNYNQNIIQNKTDVISYEYKYEIIIDDIDYKINGLYYNNENKMELDNNYETKDNYIYFTDDLSIKVDILNNKLNYNNIKSFIKNYDYESKTEYKDGTIKYVYTISNIDINNYFNEDILNEESSIITIYENNYIYKVEFDLSKFYNKDKYFINIEYNNVNNIGKIETKEDINK